MLVLTYRMQTRGRQESYLICLLIAFNKYIWRKGRFLTIQMQFLSFPSLPLSSSSFLFWIIQTIIMWDRTRQASSYKTQAGWGRYPSKRAPSLRVSSWVRSGKHSGEGQTWGRKLEAKWSDTGVTCRKYRLSEPQHGKEGVHGLW